MRNSFTFFIFLIVLCGTLPAQNNVLSAKFDKHNKGKVYLYSFYGLKTNLLDSCEIKNRKIKFKNKGNYTGFYRIQLSGDYYDCILTPEEETKLHFRSSKLNENIEVIKGENQILYEKLRSIKLKSRNESELIKKNSELSVNDKKSRLNRLTIKEDSLTQLLLKEKPLSYFNATAKAILPHTINLSFLEKYNYDTLYYYKNHFFDEVDFKNSSLVRSTVLPNLYMKYFSRFVDYDEAGFKFAIDLIMRKSSQNQSVYNLSLEYLLELFQINGPEIIFEYTYQTYYLKESCEEIHLSNETKQKINQYKELSPGQKAPIISNCVKLNGEQIKELTFDTKKSTLVFFWSTHCQFCKELLYAIAKLDITKHNVIGININENIEEWKNFSSINQISFLNLYTEGSWDSPLSRKYLINKTPGIFLINEHGIISERNLSVAETINFLSREKQ